MNPFLTQQLANQRIDEMHRAAARARLARQGQPARTQQHRSSPAFAFRRRGTCAP